MPPVWDAIPPGRCAPVSPEGYSEFPGCRGCDKLAFSKALDTPAFSKVPDTPAFSKALDIQYLRLTKPPDTPAFSKALDIPTFSKALDMDIPAFSKALDIPVSSEGIVRCHVANHLAHMPECQARTKPGQK